MAFPAAVWCSHLVALGCQSPDDYARRRMGYAQRCQGLLPADTRLVLRKENAAPGSGGLGGGGGRGGTFQYKSEERAMDGFWPRWIRADLRDGEHQQCPGTQTCPVGAKRRKKSKSLEPPSATREEYQTASPVARESISSWCMNSEGLETFGRQVERIMTLPGVPRKQEHLVPGGLLALGRLAATIDARCGLDRLTRVLSTISDEGLNQASEESYYDAEEEGPVSPELARRGVGEVGTVPVVDSIWRRCVPADLLRRYNDWDKKYASGIPW